jgi:hypothetical protein
VVKDFESEELAFQEVLRNFFLQYLPGSCDIIGQASALARDLSLFSR